MEAAEGGLDRPAARPGGLEAEAAGIAGDEALRQIAAAGERDADAGKREAGLVDDTAVDGGDDQRLEADGEERRLPGADDGRAGQRDVAGEREGHRVGAGDEGEEVVAAERVALDGEAIPGHRLDLDGNAGERLAVPAVDGAGQRTRRLRGGGNGGEDERGGNERGQGQP